MDKVRFFCQVVLNMSHPFPDILNAELSEKYSSVLRKIWQALAISRGINLAL